MAVVFGSAWIADIKEFRRNHYIHFCQKYPSGVQEMREAWKPGVVAVLISEMAWIPSFITIFWVQEERGA